MKRLLFIDNYDSFTYNVVHLLRANGASVDVSFNDDDGLSAETLQRYDGLVVGPGPGNPSQKPRMLEVLRAALDGGRPVLGVCLGLQALGEAYGAEVVRAPRVMHGKTSLIEHDGEGLFRGLASPFVATRYHSLCLAEATLPSTLRVTARSEDGVIQGVRAINLPAHAVQFHPESVLSEAGDEIARNFMRMLD